MPHVLLLRAPTLASTDSSEVSQNDDGRDPYEVALEPLKSISVPVYETVQVMDELKWILETGPSFHGYKGVVLTSKRSVDAWANASDAVQPPSEDRAPWSSIPFYVVGEATGRAVRKLSEKHDGTSLAPGEVLGAEETGTGELLAHFILARLAAERSPSTTSSASSSSSLPLSRKSNPSSAKSEGRTRKKTKLLFLVGDKTKDSLPTILGEDQNVELDSVQVYETKPSPKLSQTLRDLVAQNKDEHDWWIATFAPSGIEYALPHLEEHFEIPQSSDLSVKTVSDPEAKPRVQLAAIGPTTATYMHEKMGLEVSAVAAKPNPAELAKAIHATRGISGK